MMFHIGQKVVCVDDSGLTGLRNGFPSIPSKGGVYTVRGISQRDHCRIVRHTGPGQQGLWLDEIKNPVVRFTLYDWVGEGSFKLHRFRPVVEKSTDAGMAILKEILDRETVRDPVQATS